MMKKSWRVEELKMSKRKKILEDEGRGEEDFIAGGCLELCITEGGT